ncbi:hypothetical protein BDE02_08G029900 [Populus trichocarpa]|jgi:shikimate O-hydroxycinnamoyltransferase|nr:hypothetical protein BDE02_08G029900 [Populus trichocarpa]
MVKIEVHVISREIIKPSSPTIHNLQPYKLCLLDQLTPTSYAPMMLFYPKSNEANMDDTQFLKHLKRSLSDTVLNVLYPFSGRVKTNMFVDRFDEGVPFMEARVNCSLSEFFEHPQIEYLNQFLPCPPLAKESQDDVTLLIFQLSVFSCGGLALGGCMSHKLGDGGTASTLFSASSAISQGSSSCDFEALLPNLAKASLVFPPRNDVPRQLFSLVDDKWFVENNCITN